MRNRIIEAINTWCSESDNRFTRWILAEELNDKHREKIVRGFGAGVPCDTWVAVCDTTIGKNGKQGIIFTDEKLILHKGLEIVLDEVEAAYKVNVLQYIIKDKDGIYHNHKSETGIREAIPILQLMTGIRQATEPPKEEYQELHTTYRRELRRRMNQMTKLICEKDTNFVSIEMADEEFIQNALVRLPQIDKSKILAFLKTTRGNGKESVVITEESMYFGTGELLELSLDGLLRIHREDGLHYALYTNHYINNDYFFIPEKDTEFFYELIDGYYSIYKELKKEIEDGNVSMSGLDLSDGFHRYLENREDHFIESYKNAVFVSSTFRDMHFERDIIHEKVQPALNALADQYGESLSFCDLRWGVNTENLDSEEGAKKVLIVCLDEIEKCDPYMLIMLGERYGWIPNERTIKNALENRPDFILDELEKSVTALEIEFGALSKTANKDRIFVYFREMDHLPSDDYASEDGYHEEQLKKLKERVRKLAPDRVKTYQLSWDEESQTMNGVDTFAQMVIEDIGTVMEQAWCKKEKPEPFIQEVQQHLTYMKQKSALCYAREELIKSCLEQLENGMHIMALTGVSGCGKSTIMGALAHILTEVDVNVLPIFCGLTRQTETALGIVKHICYYLEDQLHMPHLESQKKLEDISEEYWLSYQSQLMESYTNSSDKPLMILIDAIDQLTPDHIRNNLKFIPKQVDTLSSKVYMMISCLPEFELAAFPVKFQVSALTQSAKEQVIQGILKRNRRELDAVVVKKIMEKQASDSPLYLTLLIQRLLMMNKNDFDDIMADGDGMSAITKHQLDMIGGLPEDIPGICREMIDVAAGRIGGAFVKQAIAYLAISHHGLRESDLEGLLVTDKIHWNRLEFSLFINYLRNIFVLREDGCYDFSHKVFRQIFTYQKEEKQELHRKLFRWLEHLPKQDSLRERELLSHCIDARESKAFMHHMAECMKEERDVKALDKQMLELCREDHGDWLVQMVRSIETDAMSGEEVMFFLRYIVNKIGRAFNNSNEDLAIREKLFSELLPVAEYLSQTEGGLENERRVGVVYARLGRIYETLKNYPLAEVYYKKELGHGLALMERYKTDQVIADAAIDYRMLANIYHTMGKDEQALPYHQKSVELAEEAYEQYPASLYVRRTLSWSYKRLGDYYDDKEMISLAIEYYEKCRKIRTLIVEDAFTVSDGEELANILEIIGHRYYKHDRKFAKQYYQEQVKWREIICQAERTMEHMKELAWAYNDLGYEYFESQVTEDKLLALDCYEKCIPILEELLKMDGNENTCWHLANDYEYCMMILGTMKDLDNQQKMMKYAHRAWELYERRVLSLGSEDAYLGWVNMLKGYSELTQIPAEKRRCYEKLIELLENLYEMTKDRDYRKAVKGYKLLLVGENWKKKL